jgi:hypothetical protein
MIIRRLAKTMVAALAGAASAHAHRFLTHAVPPVGGRVTTRPAELKTTNAN